MKIQDPSFCDAILQLQNHFNQMSRLGKRERSFFTSLSVGARKTRQAPDYFTNRAACPFCCSPFFSTSVYHQFWLALSVVAMKIHEWMHFYINLPKLRFLRSVALVPDPLSFYKNTSGRRRSKRASASMLGMRERPIAN